ncbi:MAG: ABC transporter permease [Thermoleophilaceae bacterium]
MGTVAADGSRGRVAGRGLGVGRLRELVTHLAGREIAALHRFTLLGWAWPLVRQLAQLGVLVVVFSRVIHLGVPHFVPFVFSGLIAWNWFSAGVANGTSSLLDRRHLVFQPGFPTLALPLVAVAVPLVDLLLALPVLAAMMVVDGDLHWSILFMPVLVVIQLSLMAGIAWVTAAATVYFRDVRQIVLVGVTMLFYFTPVFYDLSSLSPHYQSLLRLNPLTTIVDGYHAIVLGGRLPPAGWLAAVALLSVVLAALGLVFYRRVSAGLVDEL